MDADTKTKIREALETIAARGCNRMTSTCLKMGVNDHPCSSCLARRALSLLEEVPAVATPPTGEDVCPLCEGFGRLADDGPRPGHCPHGKRLEDDCPGCDDDGWNAGAKAQALTRKVAAAKATATSLTAYGELVREAAAKVASQWRDFLSPTDGVAATTAARIRAMPLPALPGAEPDSEKGEGR